MQKKLPSINSAHGSETRNIINEIIKAINDRGLEILSESGFLTWLEENGIKHREEVATFADLPSSDSLNTVRGVESENKIYIKKENGWVPFQTIDINKISLVDEKVEDISLSVKSFGAIGDGVTDDTQAFKDAVTSGGENISVPYGSSYVISETIILNDNTRITGGGTIIDKSDTHLFYAKNKKNIDINVNVRGLGTRQNYDYNKRLIYFEECSDIKINNSSFYDYDGVGVICLRGCRDFKIKGNHIERYSYSGIMLLDGNINGVVSDNTVLDCENHTAPNTYPIMLSGYDAESPTGVGKAENIICDSNYIENEFPWWEGIDAHGGSNLKIINNTVKNCMVGIALVRGGSHNHSIDDCLISGNTLYGPLTGEEREVSNVGITLSAVDGSNNIITDNQVYDYGIVSSLNVDIGGIKITNPDSAIIKNNTIEGCRNFGIFLSSRGRNTMISGNIIKNLLPKIPDNNVFGINIQGTINYYDDIFIDNNILIDDNKYSKGYAIAGPQSNVQNPDEYTYIKETNNKSSFNTKYFRTAFMVIEHRESNPGITGNVVGKLNDIVYNSAYKPGRPSHWICVKPHEGNGSVVRAEWIDINALSYLTSEELPSNPESGLMVYYRKIGKPIWWNGIMWVDSSGEQVIIN